MGQRLRGQARNRPVRWAIVWLVTTALLAFAVVGVGASVFAGRIAQRGALAEAVRTATALSRTVFAPLLPRAVAGDAEAIRELDQAVKLRSRDGSLVRVKIWTPSGTVLYSDDHEAIGHTYPLHSDVAEVIRTQVGTADVSSLTDPENTTEVGHFRRLVEVYIPFTLADGTALAFEMYASDARLVAAERGLRNEMVPFALLALLILVISQLPVSIWLVRRVARSHNERSRLLASAVTASGRERHAIARDLHDGVVQDLAGATYAMEALLRTPATREDVRSRHLVDTVSRVLGEAVASLRTLIVAIYPPDLSAHGLQKAIAELGDRLGPATQVTTTSDIDVDLPPEISALVYRCARECLANVGKHAHATRAEVHLTETVDTVRLEIRDNGVGAPPGGYDKRADGHVGLHLLADAARELGGHLHVGAAPGGGTSVLLEVPADLESEAVLSGAPRRSKRSHF